MPAALSTFCSSSCDVQQCCELTISTEVGSPPEKLRPATSTDAAVPQQKGKHGFIKSSARADLLVLGGDPLRKFEVLAPVRRNRRLILRGGRKQIYSEPRTSYATTDEERQSIVLY